MKCASFLEMRQAPGVAGFNLADVKGPAGDYVLMPYDKSPSEPLGVYFVRVE